VVDGTIIPPPHSQCYVTAGNGICLFVRGEEGVVTVLEVSPIDDNDEIQGLDITSVHLWQVSKC